MLLIVKEYVTFVALRRGACPKLALANNMWYGEIPSSLKGLSYIEKLLVSRVRHNRYIVKVLSSGSCKMIANVISFQHPSQKIYAALPPPPSDLDDVVAFVFTGPSPTTEDDFRHTQMLVRHAKVFHVLHWLKLNHVDYADLEIAMDNLMAYPDFPMHVLKAFALQRLKQGGKILAIGREADPETLWNNPSLCYGFSFFHTSLVTFTTLTFPSTAQPVHLFLSYLYSFALLFAVTRIASLFLFHHSYVSFPFCTQCLLVCARFLVV